MKNNWTRRIGAAVLAVGMAISLTACGETSFWKVEKAVHLTEKVTQNLTPGMDAPTLDRESANKLTDFGLQLAWRCMGTTENALISPMSVATVLAMAANGAEGETLEEMETVLGMDRSTLNTVLHAYWVNLPKSKQAVLKAANSIWCTDRDDFTVEQQFLQDCVDYYGADVFQAPMDNQTCQEINRWINKKTNGMISDMLQELSPNTILSLINALAFEGEWAEPYEKNQVQEGVFLTAEGMPVRTEFLYSQESQYFENDVAIGVMKPYEGGRYAFVGLLPKDGLTLMALLDTLDGESLQNLLRAPQAETVETSIPKFDTTYCVKMRNILTDMGMPLAFESQRAEFAGIGTSSGDNIFIDQVIHQTFLSLGEKGTRAAAATVAEMAEGCAMEPEEPKEVFLDQPFLYLLMDTDTCVPFLIGVMKDPTGSAPEGLAGGRPLSVQVDGVLYESTGEHGFTGPRCGTMSGEITSSVEPGTTPQKDDQSNFGTGWGYQKAGETIEVNFGRHWIVFERAA